MATGLHYAGDFELWLRFFQFDTLYYIKNCVGMFRYREGQLSSHFEKYINEVNQTYSKLKLNTNDKKTIETYQRKKKIADVINRTRFINGDKIVRLKSFEKKHFLVPPFLTWINDEIGYAFEE